MKYASTNEATDYVNPGSYEDPLIKYLSPLNTKALWFKKKSVHLLPFGEDKFIWLILKGWMLGLRGDCDGHVKGTGLYGSGEIIGLIGLSGKTKDVPVYSLGDVHILRIPTLDFRRQMESYPKLSLYMVNYMSERYNKLLDELEQSTLLTLDQQIQVFLRKIDQIPKEEKINISETIMAWAIGAHPGSVCRALKGKNGITNRMSD
jgi:CRP-like cAMP-binding protein